MENWKRKFAIIWSGQLFSILSSAIVGYAVVFWISVETRSAEVLSLAVMATLLPQAILGPVAGVYVDRWKRKRTMIAADMFVALCSLILGILFYAGKAELGYIYLLLALRSVGSAFHSPAMQAAIPLLAPETELMRISGVNQAIQSVCSIAGPALGALFITSFNMTVVMLLDVAGALIACTALLFVVIPDPVVTDKIVKKSVLREMKAGVQEVRQHKGLGELMGISSIGYFYLNARCHPFPFDDCESFRREYLSDEFSRNCLGERDAARRNNIRHLENKNP